MGSDHHAIHWAVGRHTDLGLDAATLINDSGLFAGQASGILLVPWTPGLRTHLPAADGGRIACDTGVNRAAGRINRRGPAWVVFSVFMAGPGSG